ncbi:lamin tail domain-containing protein, partial [Flavobacterium sp. j3]
MIQIQSQNLLVNGNFETGTVFGFFSNGAGYVRIFPPFTGTTAPGNWAFTNNPQLMNTASFVASGDHTTGSGLMLVFDGNTTGGQQNFWEAGNGGGGVCGLTVGATYTFSYWIRSVFGPVSGAPTRADIRADILNASAVTLISGATLAPLTASGWQRVAYTFIPNSACVNIKLYNNNTGFDGNDFAIDDMSVTAAPLPLAISVASTNITCPNANNGSIVVSGVNGVVPYTNYTISGAASQSNTTGIFTGLAPGTYSVSVTDSNTPPAVVSQSNIVITQPANLTVSAIPSTICSGASTTLSVSGSANPYSWTASPADPSITNPISPSLTVNPTQTTTYTASSTSGSPAQLITNGNFSAGNTGFNSDYQFLTVTIPAGAQRTYGIVTNSNAWFPGFASCTANGGTGNMMVVDGSNLNAGNDRVWFQTIPVVPGQNYTFSYWIQTVATPNPANIDVVINGTSIGTALAPATSCNWVQRSYVWNSGASSTAQIVMFNRTTSSAGNDFALDDISFTTTAVCNLSNSVTITVNPSLAPTISCGTATANAVTFNWNAVTGATNYAILYSINNGPNVNAGTVTGTSFTVNALSPGDSVRIDVIPGGTGVGACFTAASQTCVTTVTVCPVPVVAVTQQPTCAVPTGTIVFTSPINSGPLPTPGELFISEVTDESTGSLSYVEIFNGTGAPVNLSNYKLKVYNNGNTFISPNCDITLSGTLNNNDVYVVALGDVVNQGGVIPDLVVANCGGFNTDDNVRLATSADVIFDLWGRTDGVDFTPSNQAGYTYRRLQTAPKPSLIWNPADWTAIDPQDYTNMGTYTYATTNYQYSINGTNYQVNPVFTGLAPGTYNVTVRDLVSGCISTPIPLVVNPIPAIAAPTVNPISYCLNAAAVPLTATPIAGGTLNWYGTNATGGTATATAPTPSTTTLGTTTFYVSQTVGGCESPRAPIVVTISNQAPSQPPQLFCDVANSTPNSVAFDFNNIGQTNFTYSYSIDGGPVVSGIHVSPSNFTVPNVLPGQTVTFTLTWNGVCAPTLTASTLVPTFTQLGPFCQGQEVPVLPTTSLNGRTGTWSPAVINPNTTTTYIFTPNAGQCASRASMTIVINPNTTPTFNPVAPICSGQPLTALPTNSLNGISGTWSPALNNTATTTYTFTPSTGNCGTTTTLTITVNPNVAPTFNPVAPICAGQTLTALPTTSLNGITGTWSPALNNTATTTYTFTPTAGQCATTATLTITVNPNVTPTFNAVAPICSGQTLSPLPITSLNGITGTWSPALNNTATTTYTFTPSSGQCSPTATLTITVNPNVTPTFNAVAPICAGQTLTALPTTSLNGIAGTWSPALNNTTTTTYIFTPNTGQCGLTTTLQIVVNPNIIPTFTPVAPTCAGSVIAPLPTTALNGITGTWSPAINNTATTTYTFTPTAGQCATTATLGITILQQVTPTFSPILPICTGGTLNPLPTTSLNGITGTWSPALSTTATTTYTFTPNSNQCANTTTLQIVVVPQINPAIAIVESCNANSVTVTNPVGPNFEYSLDGAPYQTTPVFVNLSAGNHFITVRQTIANCISNPINFVINPVVNDVVVNPNPQPLRECDANNDEFADFDLTQAINGITGGTPYTVTFHETLTDATIDGTFIPNPTSYLNINNVTQIIYVRVESSVTSCFEVVQLQLIVDPTPEATTPSPYALCDYTGIAGFETFDLTTTIPEI